MFLSKSAVLLCLVLASTAKADNIYNTITNYNPKIDKVFAKKLANKLQTRAKQYDIDPKLALAVLLQESGLKMTTTFKTEVIAEEYCNENNCYKINKQTQTGFDFSFAQINIGTIKNYRMDIKRLYNNDVDYVLDCFFLILKDKIQMCAHLSNSWACYHSINSPHRERYIELVGRYLK